ncbi:Protein ApaG [Linum perenne]
MNALNLKLCPDFGVGARRSSCLFTGRSAFSSDLERRPLLLSLGFPGRSRSCRIVACSAEGNDNGDAGETSSSSSSSDTAGSSANSFFRRSETYALLKKQMVVAAQAEVFAFFRPSSPFNFAFKDYKEAARIRDSLRIFEEEEPLLRLRQQLKDAIEDERFGDAAKYRDELNQLAPHSLLKCSSDTTTLGIRVQVRSVYIESRSQPLKGQYFFAYRIRITNNSDRPVQLLRRHWVITDANGKTENVWGMGVIGEQPVILAKTGFEYSSACPLSTPNGRMEGDFEMKHIDKVGSSSFNVAIAPFSLSTLGNGSDIV